MLCFKRRAVVGAALCLTLGACGFTPIAATPGDDGEIRLSVTAIDVVASQPDLGYEVRKYLDRRVRVTEAASEALRVQVTTETESLSIQQNDTVTRLNITAVGAYALTGDDPEQAATGEVTAVTAVNATTDFFATRTSTDEATRLLGQEIGRKLVTVLYARRETSQ